MAAPASLALPAADLERHDDEIAGHKIFYSVAYLDNDAGGLVPQRKGAGQTGLALDDRETEIATCPRERAPQRPAVVLQSRCGQVPPYDAAAADIGGLRH